MRCHPETKSKVRPKKKYARGGGAPGARAPPSFQSVPYISCTTNEILHTVPPQSKSLSYASVYVTFVLFISVAFNYYWCLSV